MDIFTLTDEDGRLFSPVRQAATFAKYSRSPESARVLIGSTSELAGTKFQKKWIVDFGHNSIAELATLPIAFEDVSIIASKTIEAWQRPGVCEKSTRMQEFSRGSLYIPEGIDKSILFQVLPLVDKCFTLYEDMLTGDLKATLIENNPKLSEFQANRMVFDMARYLLPAGVLTNLGICAYPRDIASMIAELRGSSNPEFQTIGNGLQSAAEALGGPLIRHTKPDEWVHCISAPIVKKFNAWWINRSRVVLTRIDIAEQEFFELLRERYKIGIDDLNRIMLDRPRYKNSASHAAPKVFREVRLDFSIYMDYGAYRDLQRHRRMEQFVEPLTNIYGFATPPGLEDISANHYERYQELLLQFRKLPWPEDPQQQILCQYLVPMAFIVGWHVKMDLEQLYYLVELRTQEAGHPSYREVAYQLWAETAKTYPTLTQWIRPRGPKPLI